MPEFKAKARFVRISPRKVRYVIDLIRGENVNKALEILEFTPRRGAHFVKKLVKSAVANAEQFSLDPSKEGDVDVASLYIKDIRADGGPTLKRHKYRAMGRINRILKRTSHISVTLSDEA